jgi:hypothetical protein
MTVALLVLGLVVITLIAERQLERRSWQAERRHLVAVAVARTPREVSLIERPAEPKKQKDPDERPVPLVGA